MKCYLFVEERGKAYKKYSTFALEGYPGE